MCVLNQKRSDSRKNKEACLLHSLRNNIFLFDYLFAGVMDTTTWFSIVDGRLINIQQWWSFSCRTCKTYGPLVVTNKIRTWWRQRTVRVPIIHSSNTIDICGITSRRLVSQFCHFHSFVFPSLFFFCMLRPDFRRADHPLSDIPFAFWHLIWFHWNYNNITIGSRNNHNDIAA